MHHGWLHDELHILLGMLHEIATKTIKISEQSGVIAMKISYPCISFSAILVSISSHAAWALPPCPGDTHSVWTDCFGFFTLEDGSTYSGDWKDNNFHGIGTFSWPDRTRYHGDWQFGEQTGKGSLFLPNGEKYTGDFYAGIMSGIGTYSWPTGEVYEGEFHNDMMHGKGTYTWPNGDKYVGDFFEGYFEGLGIKTYADGRVAEGIWKRDKFLSFKRITQESPSFSPSTGSNLVVVSSGSGFVISKEGHIVTNHHVISKCTSILIHTDMGKDPARVVVFDAFNDLAVLQGSQTYASFLNLNRGQPELLQEVYVAGFPFGDQLSSSVKVTKGIVSALTGIGNNFSQIQIDAAIQSGNSGGPILDDSGSVLGVTVSKLNAEYMLENFGVIPENTNFGVKASVLVELLRSNDIPFTVSENGSITSSDLGRRISDTTVSVSCWAPKLSDN